jgi:hypothetical protein
MPNFISEDQIERALVQKLQHLHGFDVLECHTKDPEDLDDGGCRVNLSGVAWRRRVTPPSSSFKIASTSGLLTMPVNLHG